MPPMDEKEQKEFDELKAAKAANEKALEEANKKLKELEDGNKGKGKSKSKKDDEEEDDDEEEHEEEGDLDDKVRKQKEANEKSKGQSKAIESALKFNMTVADFVKNHSEILPSDVAEMLAAAEKENYDGALDKATAIRVGIIKSFFSVQENIDLLTASQKKTVEEYLKLTQNGRREKAESIYENVFEPAFESLKRLRKAEEVGRARTGISAGSKSGDAYKAKLMAGSRKTYLGEKGEK